MVDTFITP